MKKNIAGMLFICLASFVFSIDVPLFIKDWSFSPEARYGEKSAMTLLKDGGLLRSSTGSDDAFIVRELVYQKRIYEYNSLEQLTGIGINLNTTTTNNKDEWFAYHKSKDSFLPLPEYLVSRGLDWSKPYVSWGDFLFSSPDWTSTIVRRPLEQIKYLDSDIYRKRPLPVLYGIIESIWKADPHFKITLVFSGRLPSTRDSDWTLNQIYFRFSDKTWPDGNIEFWKTSEWNQRNISEQDKFTFAFSSNLVELNKGAHWFFSGIYSGDNEKKKYTEILHDFWSIETYQDLIKTIENLDAGGHAGAYWSNLALLNKYPGMSPRDIIDKENLTILDGSRLFFARDMQVRLGEKGIEAWDKGREITLLRWGTAIGIIGEKEAYERVAPIVETLKNDYTSWEDYMAHYIIGREYYGLGMADHIELTNSALTAALISDELFQFSSLAFPSVETQTRKSLTFSDIYYLPKLEAEPWQIALQADNLKDNDKKKEALDAIREARKQCPENLAMINEEATILALRGEIDSARKLLDESASIAAACPAEFEIFQSYQFLFISLSNSLNKPQDALLHVSLLPVSCREYPFTLFQTGYAYACLYGIATTNQERLNYYTEACDFFVRAEHSGYSLPANIQKWMRTSGHEK